MKHLKSVWEYRSFVFGSIQREFQSKYRNSLLGAAWTIINPLAMIVVYTVIFSQIMRAKLPGIDNTYGYSIYLCTGIITWGLFAEITSKSQSMFMDNANMLKKINFPRITLPLIATLNSLVNFFIIFSLFLIFLIAANAFPGWIVLSVIPVLIIQIILANGLGLILGLLHVFFRDVGQFLGVFLQFWFWLTPIIYPSNILPDGAKKWIEINPMYHIITSYQKILVLGQSPDWTSLIFPLLLGLILCYFGTNLFKRHSGDMIDEL